MNKLCVARAPRIRSFETSKPLCSSDFDLIFAKIRYQRV